MVTQQEPADLAQLASLLGKRQDAAPASLRAAGRERDALRFYC